MTIKFEHINKNLLTILFTLGVMQAFIVNYLGIGIQLVSLFMIIYMLVHLPFQRQKRLFQYDILFVLLLFFFAVLFLYAMTLDFENKKEIAFHGNVIAAFFFSKFAIRSLSSPLKFPTRFLWIYCIASLIMYFMFWDTVAGHLNTVDSEFLALKTNGFKRNFGLLFNPLSNAYFLLITFYFLYGFYENGKVWLKLLVVISILLALTRGAIVPMGIFFVLKLVINKQWRAIFILITVCILAYYFLTPVQIIIDSIVTLQDSQGSAQAHQYSIQSAIDVMLKHPMGIGFADFHSESWVLQYGAVYGFLGIGLLLSFFIVVLLKLILEKRIIHIAMYISILPATIIIPFYTFNLPIVLFFVFSFLLYYNKLTLGNAITIASDSVVEATV